MGRTATLTLQVEIESCPDYPRVFPFWIWRETTATSVPASLCHSSRSRPENFHSNMTLVRDKRRKAVCIIFLNQMSPRHTSGILYEYPQVTTCFRIPSVTSHHVTLRTGGRANVNKLLISLRVTIEESNKAKYFEVLAPWLTFVPFMGAQIVLIEKRIEVIFDCQR